MKQKEIIQLSDADLNSRVNLGEEQLSKMKITHSVTPMENPMQIRSTRKLVARLKTEIGKRKSQA